MFQMVPVGKESGKWILEQVRICRIQIAEKHLDFQISFSFGFDGC